jgi:ribosomal protein S18 acetylase RimI-like enzyme
MAAPRIRRADESDWQQIWPFWHEIVAAGDTYAYPPDIDSAAGRALWFGVPPEQTWVAELGSELVATYHLGPNHAGPGSHIANASYMVSAGVRGLGIGRTMVVHSIEQASEAGYRGMQFNAVAASNLGAVRLYSDLGFEVVGRIPGGFRHPSQGFVELLIMFRPL